MSQMLSHLEVSNGGEVKFLQTHQQNKLNREVLMAHHILVKDLVVKTITPHLNFFAADLRNVQLARKK